MELSPLGGPHRTAAFVQVSFLEYFWSVFCSAKLEYSCKSQVNNLIEAWEKVPVTSGRTHHAKAVGTRRTFPTIVCGILAATRTEYTLIGGNRVIVLNNWVSNIRSSLSSAFKLFVSGPINDMGFQSYQMVCELYRCPDVLLFYC